MMEGSSSANVNNVSVRFDNPAQTVTKMQAIVPELKAWIEQLPTEELTDSERTISFLAGTANLYERILLLCGGTFALTLNLIAPASAQLDKHGIHLSLSTHLLLYLGWVCLTIAVISSGILWLRKHNQKTVLGARAILNIRATRTLRTLGILSRLANTFDGIHAQSTKEDGRTESIDVSAISRELTETYSAYSAKVTAEFSKNQKALQDDDPAFSVKMTVLFSSMALIATPLGYFFLLLFAMRLASALL